MIPRRLPPVYSPLDFGAIRESWSTVLSGDGGATARAHRALTERYGARELLLTDSGTSALALAIGMAVGAVPGRPRVALPAWACYDLASAVDLAAVHAVPYDLDPASLGPDWDSFDRALRIGVAAAVVVHPYGLPLDLEAASRRCAAAGAILIEDAAQAIGATIGDRPAGAVGSLGVLSFGRGKGWTGGGGGALLLNAGAPESLSIGPRTELRGPGRGLGAAVKLTAQWMLARPATYAIPSALPFLQLGKTVYRQAHQPGQMNPVEAAVILATLARVEPETATRSAHAKRLAEVIAARGAGWVPSGWQGGVAGWLRLPFLPNPQVWRRLGQGPAAALGILPAYPIPLYRLPGFVARVELADTRFPGAEDLGLRLHTMPTHGLLREEDLTRLEEWISAS